jgi:hypothetical protein
MSREIDWEITGTFFSGVGSILSGLGSILAPIAVIVVAFLAKETFSQWAKKQTFPDKRDKAVAILTAFDNAQRAFGEIRAPNSFGWEINNAKEKFKDGNPSDQEIQSQVTFDRISQRNKIWEEISQNLPLAKVLFGEEARDALLEVFKVRGSIMAAITTYPKVTRDRDEQKRLERIILCTDKDDDEICAQLATAEAVLADKLEKIISGDLD